jgi:hypothetical protein
MEILSVLGLFGVCILVTCGLVVIGMVLVGFFLRR